MFEIYNIYVGQADCFLIVMEEEINEVGRCEEDKVKKYFTILVDGGFAKDKIYTKVKEILAGRELNVIVATHVDRDHISGIINFINLTDIDLNKTVILFNKFDEENISYRDGEKLFEKVKSKANQDLLLKSYLEDFIEENKKIAWDSKRILDCKFYSINQRKKIKTINKESVIITIVGPKHSTIREFMQNWKDNKIDPIITNKSSIVIIIEYNDYSVLMLGDAYLNDVKNCINEIKCKIPKIDLIKVSHHGAKENNEGLWEFARQYNCRNFMITIDEKQDDETNHPNRELIKTMPNDYNISCGKTIECSDIAIIQCKNKVVLSDEELS